MLDMLKQLFDDFKNPSEAFRSKVFWAWNGELECNELRRQVQIMKQMGLGGFFIHSRVGLVTEYLGEKWFECVEACIDEAQKQGLEVWLYDEDRWSSGSAGGMVTKKEEYRQRQLECRIFDSPSDYMHGSDTIALFAAHIDHDKAKNIRKIQIGQDFSLAENEKLLAFVVTVQKPESWYNNQTYLDTMNSDAVAEFINLTHEKYKKHDGQYFGTVIPGIFTDEPNHGEYIGPLNSGFKGYSVPWTGCLPHFFKNRYGYEIIDHLPEIFFDREEDHGMQVRYHYHDCTTELFVNAFTKQIGRWCNENGIILTGHMQEENLLSWQARKVGSCMRHYEHMQAPGMDVLAANRRIYNVAKQVSSVARQTGSKWRLTETYGCTGWDFPFSGHKALGDWQAAMGINLRCLHLAWYTMLGEAKRDFPASISYQSPWWKIYSKVEDYFSRINLMMSNGEEQRRLLVVSPIESMWLLCTFGNWRQRKEVIALDHGFTELTDRLLSDHIDFDYSDECLISRLAEIIEIDGSTFLKIGAAKYSAVIIPEVLTLRKTTLDLLENFKKRGGVVVFINNPPSLIDALPSTLATEFSEDCLVCDLPELSGALGASCRCISITDENGNEIGPIVYQLREDEHAQYLFVCNIGHEFSENTDILNEPKIDRRNCVFNNVTIRGFKGFAGRPLELNPENGAIYEVDAIKEHHGGWQIKTSLDELGSRIFVVGKTLGSSAFKRHSNLIPICSKSLGGCYNIALSENNVFPMDWPEYRINGGAWSDADILEVDDKIRDILNITRRGSKMVQPWAQKDSDCSCCADVELRYFFKIEGVMKAPLSLAIEKPYEYVITLNGYDVDTSIENGWWCDKSMRTIPLENSKVKTGVNELVLSCKYNERHPGLEAIYLLGDFGVRFENNLCLPSISSERVERLSVGDWCTQGLPFFSGAVTYTAEIMLNYSNAQKVYLSFGKFHGVAAKIIVNGNMVDISGWAPYRTDISGAVANNAVNTIAIEIFGSRRNSHGPLHMNEKWPVWTGPKQFREKKGKGYNLVPCGLLEEIKILFMRADV